MKTSKLLQALQAILLFCILTGIKANAQSINTFSRPGNSSFFGFDSTGWIHLSDHEYTYNSKGLLLQNLAKEPVTNQNRSKKVITYDAFDNRISQLVYNWSNGNWVLDSGQKDSITYTPANKIAVKITRTFASNAWVNSARVNYAYDASNNRTEELYAIWANNAWLPTIRLVTTNKANGTIDMKQNYHFANGAWVLDRTDQYTAWHVANLVPASFFTILHLNNSSLRTAVSLGPNGAQNSLEELFHVPTGTWRGNTRITETRDSRGNLTNWLNEQNLNGTWQVFMENQYAITYNHQFNITEFIFRSTDGSTSQAAGPLKNKTRDVFSNYQTFTIALGTTGEELPEAAITIFPNPAQDVVNILWAENANTLQKATVSDLTGKTLLIQTFEIGDQKQLNVEKLPAGIYLLTLETEKGTAVKKFLKQ